MVDAPKGSVFVWCNSHIDYPLRLAKTLGRTDLQIISPGQLELGRFRGAKVSGVVLDHAAGLTSDQWRGFEELRWRVKASITEFTVSEEKRNGK